MAEAKNTPKYDESINKNIFAKEVDDSILPCLSLQVVLVLSLHSRTFQRRALSPHPCTTRHTSTISRRKPTAFCTLIFSSTSPTCAPCATC